MSKPLTFELTTANGTHYFYEPANVRRKAQARRKRAVRGAAVLAALCVVLDLLAKI